MRCERGVYEMFGEGTATHVCVKKAANIVCIQRNKKRGVLVTKESMYTHNYCLQGEKDGFGLLPDSVVADVEGLGVESALRLTRGAPA